MPVPLARNTVTVKPVDVMAAAFTCHEVDARTWHTIVGVPGKGMGKLTARFPVVFENGTLARPRCTIGEVDARHSTTQAPSMRA